MNKSSIKYMKGSVFALFAIYAVMIYNAEKPE